MKEYLYIFTTVLILMTIVCFISSRKKAKKKKELEAKLRNEIRDEAEKERQIKSWQSEMQDMLPRYVNDYPIRIGNEMLSFKEGNNQMTCWWNGIIISVGYHQDEFVWFVAFGKGLCCPGEGNLHDVNFMSTLFNKTLNSNDELKREVHPFEIEDNFDCISTINAYNFPKLMLREKAVRERIQDRLENDDDWDGEYEWGNDSLVKSVVKKAMQTIEKLFQFSIFKNLADSALALGNFANVMANQLNKCESPAETSFQFKSEFYISGFKLVGKPDANVDWLCGYEYQIDTYEKTLLSYIGPVKFNSKKTRSELDQIAEEFNTKFAGLKALIKDENLFLGIFFRNYNLNVENSAATIIALHKTFLEKSKPMREFFKEKD